MPGIFPYRDGTGLTFSHLNTGSKICSTSSIPARTVRRHCARYPTHYVRVLPAGIEPTSQPPQGCVLSVERRERRKQCNIFLSFSTYHSVFALQIPPQGLMIETCHFLVGDCRVRVEHRSSQHSCSLGFWELRMLRFNMRKAHFI